MSSLLQSLLIALALNAGVLSSLSHAAGEPREACTDDERKQQSEVVALLKGDDRGLYEKQIQLTVQKLALAVSQSGNRTLEEYLRAEQAKLRSQDEAGFLKNLTEAYQAHARRDPNGSPADLDERTRKLDERLKKADYLQKSSRLENSEVLSFIRTHRALKSDSPFEELDEASVWALQFMNPERTQAARGSASYNLGLISHRVYAALGYGISPKDVDRSRIEKRIRKLEEELKEEKEKLKSWRESLPVYGICGAPPQSAGACCAVSSSPDPLIQQQKVLSKIAEKAAPKNPSTNAASASAHSSSAAKTYVGPCSSLAVLNSREKAMAIYGEILRETTTRRELNGLRVHLIYDQPHFKILLRLTDSEKTQSKDRLDQLISALFESRERRKERIYASYETMIEKTLSLPESKDPVISQYRKSLDARWKKLCAEGSAQRTVGFSQSITPLGFDEKRDVISRFIADTRKVSLKDRTQLLQPVSPIRCQTHDGEKKSFYVRVAKPYGSSEELEREHTALLQDPLGWKYDPVQFTKAARKCEIQGSDSNNPTLLRYLQH